jgi:hypothetical protein
LKVHEIDLDQDHDEEEVAFMKSDLVRNTVIDPKAMASDYNENRNDLKVEDFDTDLTPTRQSLSSRFKEKEVEAPKTQPAANRDTLEL